MKGMKWVKGRASDPHRRPVYKGLALSAIGQDYVEQWKQVARRGDLRITHDIARM
jgi:hypothetical protein